MSARSSSATSLFSLAPPPSQPLPSTIAEELDTLAEAARHADVTSISHAANWAFLRCLEYKKQVRSHLVKLYILVLKSF